jgi:hypothetical protein
MKGMYLNMTATVSVDCLCEAPTEANGGHPVFDLCPIHGGDRTAERVAKALTWLSDVQHGRDATRSLDKLRRAMAE